MRFIRRQYLSPNIEPRQQHQQKALLDFELSAVYMSIAQRKSRYTLCGPVVKVYRIALHAMVRVTFGKGVRTAKSIAVLRRW